MCGGTPYAKYYKFPFLTGKFEAKPLLPVMTFHIRFHSLQENLKRDRGLDVHVKHFLFPFLTGKFEAVTSLARMPQIFLFPFLTGKFEAQR